jgi:predicted ATP-dependent serine protease
MAANVFRIDETKAEITRRYPTGYIYLDKVYGSSSFIRPEDGAKVTEYGLPLGKISYWSGVRGIGKTRLAIGVAKKMNKLGARVLFIEGEVPQNECSGWVNKIQLSEYDVNPRITYPDRFWGSTEYKCSNICELIVRLRPHLVVIDSINEIDEFSKQNQQIDVFRSLREAISVARSHLVLMAQLNADGSVKGGTKGPHLVDITANLEYFPQNEYMYRRTHEEMTLNDMIRMYGNGIFRFRIDKNRYGASSVMTTCLHRPWGIEMPCWKYTPYTPG